MALIHWNSPWVLATLEHLSSSLSHSFYHGVHTLKGRILGSIEFVDLKMVCVELHFLMTINTSAVFGYNLQACQKALEYRVDVLTSSFNAIIFPIYGILGE